MEDTSTGVETAESGKPQLEKIATLLPGPERFRLRVRACLDAWLQKRSTRVMLILTGVLVVLLGVEYCRLARMADRLLADGPFSMSTQILAAPETMAVGESLTPNDLAGILDRRGYARAPRNQGGWFQVLPSAVQISPGAAAGGERVRMEFNQGRISNIAGLANHAALREYELPPSLITDLSENREKRRLVRFSEIPHSLVEALTAAEDKHFFHHGGFDLRRAVKAAYVDFKDGHKQQGASTLTMQLSRALWLNPGKSWRRKAEEILITLHLEQVLSKQQIFEDYANQIYLGQRGPYSVNGFGEAARVFFGKPLEQIDTAEAALLAGMVQRPNYYNPFRNPERSVSRRNVVLELMRRNGDLSAAEFHAAASAPLRLAPETDEPGNFFFLSILNDELQNTFGEAGGQNRTVVTTLDPELQRDAEMAVESGMQGVDRQLRGRIPDGARPQVALVALDPHTGAIKALVGGRNSGESQLNHALAMRQPGSAFKPFVYAAAIETAVDGSPKVFTPATVLNDEASSFQFNGQSYQPKDFHDDYQGAVTLRTALALSLNIPAVTLAQQVGYARVVSMARSAGLNHAISPTPSVALGAYETTPLELAAAYSVFANEGIRVKPTTLEVVREDGETLPVHHQAETTPSVDPRVAYITLNMMEEVLRSGTGAGARSQGFLLPAAGKTGTSHDGWFAGFTSELLCLVWVGFDDDRDLNLEGAQSALPIWADFMKRASQIYPYSTAHEFRAPAGVVSATICNDSGLLAGPDCPRVRSEVFVSGTEPTTVCDHQHITGTGDTPGGN